MSIAERRRGRPAGHRRQTLTDWVSGQGRFTMGQLARAHNWTLQEANKTIGGALGTGEIRRAIKDGKPVVVRVPGAKRPVAVYEKSSDAPETVPPADLLKVWA